MFIQLIHAHVAPIGNFTQHPGRLLVSQLLVTFAYYVGCCFSF